MELLPSQQNATISSQAKGKVCKPSLPERYEVDEEQSGVNNLFKKFETMIRKDEPSLVSVGCLVAHYLCLLQSTRYDAYGMFCYSLLILGIPKYEWVHRRHQLDSDLPNW